MVSAWAASSLAEDRKKDSEKLKAFVRDCDLLEDKNQRECEGVVSPCGRGGRRHEDTQAEPPLPPQGGQGAEGGPKWLCHQGTRTPSCCCLTLGAAKMGKDGAARDEREAGKGDGKEEEEVTQKPLFLKNLTFAVWASCMPGRRTRAGGVPSPLASI